MTKSHIPHDAVLKNKVTISSAAIIGGHSIMGDDSTVGLNSVLHQHTVMGDGAMLGMGSILKGGLPPFMLGFGNPFRIVRVNTYLMEKFNLDASISEGIFKAIKQKSPRILFKMNSYDIHLEKYLADCSTNQIDPWANLLK